MTDKIKKYRVITVHSPVQFIINTDKTGEELNQEVKNRVLELKPYPQDIMVSEVKVKEEVKVEESKNE